MLTMSQAWSKSFLRGDGGLSNVVWADSVLYAKIKDLFPLDQKVATEKLVHSIAELTTFLGKQIDVST